MKTWSWHVARSVPSTGCVTSMPTKTPTLDKSALQNNLSLFFLCLQNCGQSVSQAMATDSQPERVPPKTVVSKQDLSHQLGYGPCFICNSLDHERNIIVAKLLHIRHADSASHKAAVDPNTPSDLWQRRSVLLHKTANLTAY